MDIQILWINPSFNFEFVIYHYHKIKLGLFIFMSQKYNSYFHIGSTLCLITTLRKYNSGWYASGTDIAIHLWPFVLIAYICGFRKDSQIIEYAKYQWIDQNYHDVLKWAINAQYVICYENELKFIYLIRE